MKNYKVLFWGLIIFFINIIWSNEEYKLIKKFGHNELKSPTGIAVDKNGFVYVADGGENSIFKFTQEGTIVKKWKTTETPGVITVDEKGNLYVGENTKDKKGLVEVFTTDGKLIKKWEYEGVERKFDNKTYKFSTVGGIAVYKNYVYLGNSSTSSIQKFTTDGKFIGSFGGLHSCCGYLDLAVDSEGNIYVADLGTHSIVIYNSNGEMTGKWGKIGKKDGEFCGCCNPINIAIGKDNNIFTGEKTIPKIQKFTKNGEFLTSFGKDLFKEYCSCLDIAVSQDGKIFVLDNNAKSVYIFEKNK